MQNALKERIQFVRPRPIIADNPMLAEVAYTLLPSLVI